MKAQELRALPTTELLKKLEETRQEHMNLRFRVATRQLDNYRTLPRAKRDIARILTMLRERELETSDAA